MDGWMDQLIDLELLRAIERSIDRASGDGAILEFGLKELRLWALLSD
jgi:hypothetical protein